MNTEHFLLTGMSCGHCAASTRAELTEVPGVREVAIDVASGAVTIEGDDLAQDLLRSAIQAAGYGISAPTAV